MKSYLSTSTREYAATSASSIRALDSGLRRDTSSRSAPDTPVEDIIEQARNEYGIATVAAGGNGKVVGGVRQPQTTIICPSDLDAVISVTALNEDGTNVYWSDYNACKDISAPGMNVWSTSRYGDYDCESGTVVLLPHRGGNRCPHVCRPARGHGGRHLRGALCHRDPH